MQQYLLRLRTRMSVKLAFTETESESFIRSTQDSGLGDQGPEGIVTFCQAHKCGELCNELNLSKLEFL